MYTQWNTWLEEIKRSWISFSAEFFSISCSIFVSRVLCEFGDCSLTLGGSTFVCGAAKETAGCARRYSAMGTRGPSDQVRLGTSWDRGLDLSRHRSCAYLMIYWWPWHLKVSKDSIPSYGMFVDNNVIHEHTTGGNGIFGHPLKVGILSVVLHVCCTVVPVLIA